MGKCLRHIKCKIAEPTRDMNSLTDGNSVKVCRHMEDNL